MRATIRDDHRLITGEAPLPHYRMGDNCSQARIPRRVCSMAMRAQDFLKYGRSSVTLSSPKAPRLPSPHLYVETRYPLPIVAMSAAFIGEVAAAQVAFVRQACTFAAIALLLYETCQTANRELMFLWARGRARMIILFVTIRHLQLVSLILNSISYAFSSSSPEICTTVNLVTSITVVIPYFSWAVFLGWRAYALSNSNAFVALVVFICSASFASPSVVLIVGTTTSYNAMPPSCTTLYKWAEGPFATARLVDASRAAALLAEVVVLALTCKKTRQAWLSSKKAGRPSSLSDVLYENGVICFSVTTVLHVISLLFSVVSFLSAQDVVFATVTVFRDVFITVFLSRFILELAKVGARASDGAQGAEATRGILTTEWTDDVPDVPSQWTLNDEYNGRGFDKDVDIYELREHYGA
ncbi:hypothetical protein LXA43DRAFT_992049 [Ganoderma leucocontextum]|nr:hypothetical protein LXA43DRAFT_992049 [Ganoderma leucocontextum]